VAESVLPESDVDSVRIMTVHAAKGLEFPMVVLSGMTSGQMSPRGVQLFWKDDGYAVQLTRDVQTEDFQEQVPLDEQMSSYERMRLLYVAATRARDHLVVSLHRGGGRSTNARCLADAGAAEAAGAVQLPDSDGRVVRLAADRQDGVAPPPEFERWLADVRASAEASRRKPAMSASGLEGTDPDAEAAGPLAFGADVVIDGSGSSGGDEAERESLAAGLAKGARDVDQPAWAKGRYGSAIGRAVHGALQTMDLRTGEGLADAVAAQCVAEGVLDFEPLVTALVQSAQDSEAVKRAARSEHWRESYVGMEQEDGTILEGFVDLIYREEDGSIVIVDYKTDDVPDAALPARTAYYQPQLHAYRRVLTQAADHVGEPTLVFLRLEGS
jgi:ATP-dependent exoDNAse (exonuclease V) beta subunit